MTDFTGSSALIRSVLGERYRNTSVRLFDTVDSTNSEAKRHASEDQAPVLILADTQTGGRGRLGRSFYSPPGSGLYMTLAYTTDRPLPEAVAVTAAAAVASVTAIEQLTDRRPLIKWVNDLYLHGAKTAGILTEAVTRPDSRMTRMIVGIGINLTTRAFPDGLRAPATSLFDTDTSPVSPARLGSTIARILLDILTENPEGDFPDGLYGQTCLDVYRSHSLLIGRLVTCTRGTETFSGTVDGIGDDYALLLTRPDKVRMRLSSGEVSVRVADTPGQADP